jgi:hypothetical protein
MAIRFQSDTAQDASNPVAVPGTQIRQAELDQLAAETPLAQRALIGLGRGALNITQGVGDLVSRGFEAVGLADAGGADRRRQAVNEERALVEASLGDDTAFNIGEVVGEVGAALPLGGIAARALPGATLGRVAGQGAITGGLEGAVRLPGEGETRAQGAGIGALAGGVGAGLLGAGIRGVNALRRGTPAVNPANQEIIDLGEQFNVPVSVTDMPLSGGGSSQLLRRGDTLSESILFSGAPEFRQAQMEAAERAASGLVESVRPRGGLTTGQGIQQSLSNRQRRLQAAASARYNRATEAADKAGLVVNPAQTRQAANDIIQETSAIDLPENRRIAALARRVGNVNQANLGQAIQARSQLGESIDDAFARGDRRLGRQLVRLHTGITNDIDDAATAAGGDVLERWRDANRYFAERVAPMRERDIQAAIRSNNPDQIFGAFIRALPPGARTQGQSALAQRLYNRIGPEGRRAVQYGIVSDAMNKATQASDGSFNALAFARELRRQQGNIGVFFRGEQARQIEGMQRLFRQLERASQFSKDPATGARLVPIALAGGLGATTGPLGLLGTIAGARTMQALFTTRPGQRLLLSSSRLSPDSPRWARLIEQYQGLVGSAAAQE